MSVMKSTDELVLTVRKIFGESCPNGIILDWDEDRFFPPLTRLCADCRVVNDTDFNYSYCNSFEIEPIADLREHVCVVTFKASFILDVYSLHLTKYSEDRRHGEVVVELEHAELIPIVEKIRRFAEEQGFQEISETDHDVVIDGISLELSDVATLGKCLFDDFE